MYAHGVCGVSTVIFATGDGTESGDATIKLDAAKGKGCGRTFTLVYPDGATETLRSFNNLRGLQSSVSRIEIGATKTRTFAISPSSIGVPSRCGRLLFGEGKLGGGAGSDPVLVTRVDARTWRVASQVDGQVLCENTGEFYAMPVAFVIVASSDLP